MVETEETKGLERRLLQADIDFARKQVAKIDAEMAKLKRQKAALEEEIQEWTRRLIP